MTAGESLPDIDPALLMSPSARSEMESLASGSAFLASHVSGNPEDDTLLGMVMASSEESDNVFSVEFDSDTLEGTAVPNERVRFRIGRDNPVRDAYIPAPRGPLSQDGSVVSQVGAGGRFVSVAVPTRSQSVRPAITAPVARPAPSVAPVSKYTLLKSDPFK